MGTGSGWICQKCGKEAVAVRRIYCLGSTIQWVPASFTDDVAHEDGSICTEAEADEATAGEYKGGEWPK